MSGTWEEKLLRCVVVGLQLSFNLFTFELRKDILDVKICPLEQRISYFFIFL